MTTPLRRGLPRLGAIAAALALLAACGGKVITVGDVTVLVSRSTSAGMDALGGGRLEVVGGCLGTSGYVVLWPSGTDVVSENPVTIEIPGNGTFTLGDEVQVGGGFVLEHSSQDREPGTFEAGGVTVPAECAEHDVFLARPGP
ncbi:MAG TPA: hypothetical protein VFZ64_05700 [Nocardioidaceae bacterium]